MSEVLSGDVVHGRVKWFDPAKGFGFIVPDSGGDDILIHANVLRSFGQSSIVSEAAVTVVVQEAQRGLQVQEMLEVFAPANGISAPISDIDEADFADVDDSELQPARVKWFDRAKGFGFANVFGSVEDIFIHAEILRRSGLVDLQPGEAVGLHVIDGSRGRMASSVKPWETAVKG